MKVSRDFLLLENFTQEEKLATIVHEIGHIVNPEPEMPRIAEMTEKDRVADYLGGKRLKIHPLPIRCD